MAKAKAKAAPKRAAKPKAENSGDSDDSLLARILADPGDLETRLVYADQLIEAGDPRGTFIAQQCALDKLDPLDERYPGMLASTRRLEATHAHTWLGLPAAKSRPHARIPVSATGNAVFRNGFLDRIAMWPDDIAKPWPVLAAREPIQGIQLLVGESLPDAQRHLTEPKSFRVLEVSPDSWFTSQSAGNVLAWGMPLLRDLDLSGCDLGPTGCEILANQETDLAETFEDYVAPPPFAPGQLQRLVLKSCNIGDDGARTLFAAEHLSGLEELDLTQCRIVEKATLVALRDAPQLHGLTRLSLAGNNQLAGHLHALAGWEVLPRLVGIAVPQTATVEDLAALFPTPSRALRELDLSSAKTLLKDPASVFRIAETLALADLGSTSLGDEGLHELLIAPCGSTVVHLFANGCSLSDDGIEALATSRLLRLVTLDLSSNKLTDAALDTLAHWPGLQHVANLRIGNNRKLTAAGYTALVESQFFAPAAFDIGKTSDTKLVARLRERFGDALISST